MAQVNNFPDLPPNLSKSSESIGSLASPGIEVYRVQRTPSKNVLKSPWAVKRITKRTLAGGGNTGVICDRLLKEASILKRLKHPNVIGFRGMTKDEAGRDVLALEICTTCLHDIIELRLEEDSGPIPAVKALKVISDVAKGLDYLHNTAMIMHGDMKAPNVLVNGDFEICKLCDFGVALSVTKTGEVDRKADPKACYIGTELWSAPEVFGEDETAITTKTDIFSFGCMIYEMLSLTAPHLLSDNDAGLENDDGYTENNDSLNLSQEEEDEFDLKLEARMGTRPALPVDVEYGPEYDRIIEYYFICTEAIPEKRPSARDIIEELAMD